MQFRCLVGHGFHIDALDEGAELDIDRTLWAAIRLFEQRAYLSRMLSEQERLKGRVSRAHLFAARAEEALRHVRTLRELNARRRIVREDRSAESAEPSGRGSATGLE
jgi:two-component system chemotaxis response regulator CheB